LDGGEEGTEGVEGDGEEKRGIGDEEDESANAEDENGEPRDAAIHGVVGKMKHDEETREENGEHEECVKWSDKEFHIVIISRKNGECGMENEEKCEVRRRALQ
jgi:hypothetical protein